MRRPLGGVVGLVPSRLVFAPVGGAGSGLCEAFYLQNEKFWEWAMLGSNQRPLPCESSVIVCWRFLELAKHLEIDVFLR